jgi:hypothetical protein
MSVTLAERLDQIGDHLSRIEKLLNAKPMAKAAPGADLIWPNGHRPHFWHDVEVRTEVIALHRTMTFDAAVKHLRERFGARAPSRSSLGKFWLKLDKQRRAA